MLKFFKSIFSKRIEPVVGMTLVNKVWDDLDTIRITEISRDKKNVQYTFIQINGKMTLDNTNSAPWDWLLTQYELMEQKNKV